MTYEEFIEWTDTTAIYPDAGTGSPIEIAYLVLGLAGEIGEVMEAERQNEAEDELADVYWYMARLRRVLGPMFLSESEPVYELNVEYDLNEESLMACSSLMGNSAKKLLRDGPKPEYYRAIMGLLILAEKHAFKLFKEFNRYNPILGEEDGLSMLFNKGVKKLEKRKAEGKLKGSGSNR